MAKTSATAVKTDVKYEGGNVTVMVKDFDRAFRFYIDTLGLEKKSRYGNEWAEVAAPGLTIGLHPGRKDAEVLNLSIGLQVKNLDATVATLSSRGVKFSQVKDDGFIRVTHFADPDGNPLYLCEVKQWN